jgi:hypothetical protein
MAEFSKQWVEKNDSEMGWDFDIEDIASKMPNSTMTSYYICEGFGAIAIGKDSSGEIHLGIATGNFNDEGSEVEWKTLEEVING